MTNLINNPIFLSLSLTPLVLLGCWFLLRWAVRGPSRDAFGGFALGLSLMFLSALLFGKPNWPLGFGSGAILGALGVVVMLSLINALTLKKHFIEGIIAIAGLWVLVGMPLEPGLFLSIMLSVLVLFMAGPFLVSTLRFEGENDKKTSFISLLSLSLAATLFAFMAGMESMISLGLGVLCALVILKILTLDRFEAELTYNAVSPIILCLGFLFWWLWFNGHVPLFALICLLLVPFTKSAFETLSDLEGEAPMSIVQTTLYFGLNFVPVLLSVIFYYIFKGV